MSSDKEARSIVTKQNGVGPILRHGDLARAIAEAAVIDNPDKEITVDDKVAYIRITAEDELIIKRATIEDQLGRPFSLNNLEVELASFSGRIETKNESVRFYFDKHI